MHEIHMKSLWKSKFLLFNILCFTPNMCIKVYIAQYFLIYLSKAPFLNCYSTY